jgi:hypothetical protein
MLVTSREQCQQPIADGKLIIVNEGNEIPGRVRYCFVPGEGYILLWLHAILDRSRRTSCTIRHHGLRGPRRVIVGHHDGIPEQTRRFLPV